MINKSTQTKIVSSKIRNSILSIGSLYPAMTIREIEAYNHIWADNELSQRPDTSPDNPAAVSAPPLNIAQADI